MRNIKKLFHLIVILLISLFLFFDNAELYSNSKNKSKSSGKKSNYLTQNAKKQPSNFGKNKVFRCKNKNCGREIKTTLDAYKANSFYQEGYCSGNCRNANKKK